MDEIERLHAILATELLAPPPAPYRPGVESAAVKRARLLQLDRDLHPGRYKWAPVAAVADHLTALGGRVCDLSPALLEMVLRCRPMTAEIRHAEKQINRPGELREAA